MKVLNCFLDNRLGGPSIRGRAVANILKQRGIDTVFLFNEKQPDHLPFDDYPAYRLKHLQIFQRPGTLRGIVAFLLWMPSNVARIIRIIRADKIDIVHVNCMINIIPVIAARLAGRKTVWHLTETLWPSLLRKMFYLPIRLGAHRVAASAHRVAEWFFGRRQIPGNCHILYAPVDLSTFDRDSVSPHEARTLRRQLGLSDKDRVICSIGNINRAKGYEYLIEAARTVVADHENIKILISGAPLKTKQAYYKNLLDRVEEYELGDHILWLGFRNDIRSILAISDLFVLSSVTEACPIVVLEAMAMKVPVVATRVGGVAEQVVDGTTGFLTQPARADLLAEAISKSLTCPPAMKKEMTELGRRRAQEKFSLDRIIDHYEELYGGLCASADK